MTAFNPTHHAAIARFDSQLQASHRPPSTAFLSATAAAQLVRQLGVGPCLSSMASAIEADFLRWERFDKTPRVASHSAGGVIELMPISDGVQYSFKYVNGHPGNGRLGLPTVMAFGVLADVATGLPQFVSELTLTTALRTAATSAMAAKALARPDSRSMALIGNGAQSEFQAMAFAHLLGIEEFRLYDTDPCATAKLMRNLSAMGLRCTPCASTRDAVRGADIVTTATADKTNAHVITPDLLERGVHINGVGGDCPGKTELHPGVLSAARTFVEFEPQTRIEGDLQQMPADFRVTELWQVLAGRAPGRLHASDITVFDSVGFALEDFSALRLMHSQASALGLAVPLDLIALTPDPKNLFSALLA